MRSIFQSVIINVITSSFLKTSGIKYLLFLGDLLTLKTIQCLLGIVTPEDIIFLQMFDGKMSDKVC